MTEAEILHRLTEIQALKNSRDVDLSKKQEAKEKVYQERAVVNTKQGRFYAEQIFDWAHNFVSSKLGQMTLSLTDGNEKGLKVLAFFNDFRYAGSLNIRGGGDGFLGYKGNDHRDEAIDIVIDSPASLACRVDHRFLKKAWETIERTYSIYDTISIYDTMLLSLKQDLKI